ncbi:MAG: sialidase family protein [Wenzhouxiangella sp.]
MSWLERVERGHAFRFAVFDGETFAAVGEVARGEDWFANWADKPGLFELGNGAWLAHWLVKSGPGTYAYDVVMAVSTDQGRSWSEPFSPHDDGTQTEHGFVSYFPLGADRAGVVWLDGRETAGGGHGHDGHVHDHHHHGQGDMTLRAAVVDAAGRVSEPALLDERVCDCCQTASVMTDSGPVVIYRGRSADEIRDIRIVRRLDQGWTDPVKIHADDWRIQACPVNGPALIARGEELIAAWFTLGADGIPRVELARSQDAGASFAHRATLGSGVALGRVDLAWWQGGFVVAWLDQVDGAARLQLARFDQDAELRDQRELTTLDAGRVSGFPKLVDVNGERLLVAWTEPGAGGSQVRVAEVSVQP